ncbi:methyl-accepting chemotaxis protein [Brevibacillus borstelensis]|uniref:methyl-accepting chemotaxis protein n=1 Tax=Brevibacillus borstelensis TaxID=45462 RepID=UPI000468B446|nr:methyl-accepting chemotaxis protein [Brevibacillus borstelensis]
MGNSLKQKLVVVMSILLIISLISVSVASYWSSSSILETSLDKEAELSAKNLSEQIETFFNSKIIILETISKMISEDNDQAKDLKLIQDAQKQHPEFETFFFSYDLTGNRVINFKGEVTQVSDREHFQAAGKGEGKVIISEPVVSKRTGNNIVTIIVPLMKNNKQYGYMGSTIPINEIQTTVSEETFGQTGYAFLVSQKGTYVWNPNEELILKESLATTDIPQLQEAFQAIQSGGEGTVQYEADGKEMFASYASTDQHWGVFIAAPSEELHAPIAELMVKLLIISGVAIVLAIAVVYAVAVSMVRPIQRLNQVVQVVAKGDLTNSVTVQGKDEIAVLSRDFNQTVNHLKDLIQGVSLSSDEVLSFTKEVSAGIDQATQAVNRISSSVQQIADGAAAQAGSAQEVALSMNDMAVGIVKIAETSSRVSESAQEAAKQAEQGATVVDHAVQQMTSIGEGTAKVSTAIEKLHARSQEIESILDTISGLTSQINLLALNASIEAARAGEHGRGFAVVAGEVKSLAHQSEESAAKIAQLIQEIQQDTAEAVEAMDAGNKNVKDGVELIEEVRAIFDRIMSASRNVADHILEVSAASEEMSAGSEEVSASVAEMHAIANHASEDAKNVAEATHQQLRTIEDIAESVGKLQDVVDEMQKRLGKFTL